MQTNKQTFNEKYFKVTFISWYFIENAVYSDVQVILNNLFIGVKVHCGLPLRTAIVDNDELTTQVTFLPTTSFRQKNVYHRISQVTNTLLKTDIVIELCENVHDKW